ncbi:MAG: hypothetical protein ACJA0N_000785 [Pseudohongiellaceae bacterium]|jgi:hypothetical protein
MQHINLVSQLARVVDPPFSAKQQFQLLLALFAILLLTYGVVIWQQVSWSDDLAGVQADKRQLTEAVDSLQKKKQAIEKNSKLLTALSRLESSVKFRRELLASIDPEDQQGSGGFVEYFNGLARQQVNGLWFTEINLQQQGKQMALIGYTQKPELLPRYLQKLSSEPIFEGRQFNLLRMAQAEKPANTLRFEVKTRKQRSADEVTR